MSPAAYIGFHRRPFPYLIYIYIYWTHLDMCMEAHLQGETVTDACRECQPKQNPAEEEEEEEENKLANNK